MITSSSFIKVRFFRGFTLIELLVSVAIVAVLAATSLPAYSTLIKNAQLMSAELKIRSALLLFSADRGYSPATGMLAELVTYGYLDAIPNDPWTRKGGSALVLNKPNNTMMLAELGIQVLDVFTSTAWAAPIGTIEANDWYYNNDGENLMIYAYSHPSSTQIISSAGLPPFAPPSSTPPSSTPPSSTPPSSTPPSSTPPSSTPPSSTPPSSTPPSSTPPSSTPPSSTPPSSNSSPEHDKSNKDTRSEHKKSNKDARSERKKSNKDVRSERKKSNKDVRSERKKSNKDDSH